MRHSLGWNVFLVAWILPGMTRAADEDARTAASIRVERLRCESAERPLGIDVAAPRLSWILTSSRRGQRQTAYRVLVASSPALLAAERGDLWDSGRVPSEQSAHVVYAGRPLASRQRCHWAVRVWDRDGVPSPWSEPSTWEMALLSAADWRAQWIDDGQPGPASDADCFRDDPAPQFRKEFALERPVARARLYVSALGYYDASLNERPVGDRHLDPLWTLPNRRVFYSTYDVTERLGPGSHCLRIVLGKGWYDPLPLRMWGRVNLRERLPVGRPCFLAQLEIEHDDGTWTTVNSDPTWKVAPSAILRNNVYLGEVVDARREIPGFGLPGFDDAALPGARVAEPPQGVLQAQPLPPIRVIDTVTPERVSTAPDGVLLVDMGRNFAGWARFTFDVPAGTRITMRYGELLYPDGTLNPMTSVCGQIKRRGKETDEVGAPGVAWQTDTYVARGGGPEVYRPRFTFHAFRWVELRGLPDRSALRDVEGLWLGCDVEPVGSFACSNERFERISALCTATFRSNLFGVQSDCPHRERFGYGGDIVATCEALLLEFDMARFYAKTVRDWHDSALPDGMLTDTAPSVGIQYCGVGWAMVHPLLQRELHRYHGDRRLIEEQYATSKRWFELVRAQHPDHVVENGLHDHEALEREKAPPMVTALYAESARILSRLARILGEDEEARDYERLAERVRATWIERFLDAETGVVASGTQAAQAFALYLDLLPRETRAAALRHLVRDVVETHDGHLTTGIFGTKFLLDVLSREGHVEVAYDLVNQRTFPGWGHMLESGATTLWETWKFSDDTFSHSHPMFGSVQQWFVTWLGGIEPAPDAVGFDAIAFHPRFPADLDWVRCTHDSVRGPIASHWRRDGTHVDLELTVPVGCRAVLDLPVRAADAVTADGGPAADAEGCALLSEGADGVRLRLSSGTYRLRVDTTDAGG